MSNIHDVFCQTLQDPVACLQSFYPYPPRPYQRRVLRIVWNSIIHGTGDQYTVIFPRQSGKNELSAMLEFALMLRFSYTDAHIVKAAPSFRPQAVNSMSRLRTRIEQGKRFKRFLKKPGPDTLKLRFAEAHFVSAAPEASQVGLTASLLLECDEAQDVDPTVWDTRFMPMTASTNAVVIYYGTPWTSNTLLYREHHANGNHPVVVDWPEVAKAIPAYGRFVEKQIKRLTVHSPIVETQYLNRFLDYNVSPLLSPRAQARMKGRHEAQERVQAGQRTIICLDVASTQDPEQATRQDPRIDDSAAVVFAIEEDAEGTRTYRAIARRGWHNPTQAALVADIAAMHAAFSPSHIIIDTTGLGQGLYLVLAARNLPMMPLVITSPVKSDMGFGLIGMAEAGRILDYAHAPGDQAQATFWAQVAAAELHIETGRLCKWFVANQRLHDDQLVAFAMITQAEALPLRAAQSYVIEASDPLDE